MGLIPFAIRSFLYIPMSYNNAQWRVVQVKPLEFSTIVDNGIILWGLIQLVRDGGICTCLRTPPGEEFLV